MSRKILIALIFFLTFSMQGQAVVPNNDTIQSVSQTVIQTDTPELQERHFESGFQEKYSGDDFIYERKSAGLSQWDRFLEWLGMILRDIFTFSSESGASRVIVVIIRVLAFLIILFVAYLIVRAILNKEGMWIFGRQRKNIQVEDITAENIHEMDFSKLVNETKTSGNHRMVIRYYFLWLLKKLSSREIIDWDWDKTNSDYLYEIKDEKLKKDFQYLSYLYDYSWYGEFTLDNAEFERAEKAFQKTLNTL